MQPTRKQVIFAAELGLMNPCIQSRPSLRDDLKLRWSLSFLLHHNGSR
jgi:hypothetical protein